MKFLCIFYWKKWENPKKSQHEKSDNVFQYALELPFWKLSISLINLCLFTVPQAYQLKTRKKVNWNLKKRSKTRKKVNWNLKNIKNKKKSYFFFLFLFFFSNSIYFFSCFWFFFSISILFFSVFVMISLGHRKSYPNKQWSYCLYHKMGEELLG